MIIAVRTHPARGRTPRRADGSSDGAYRSGGHLSAGFYVLEASDIDEALHLARKDPALLSAGGIEVRPVHSGGVIEAP